MYYKKQVEKANSHKYLYHFTNFDALQKMMRNNSLRLSRITELNDPLEATRVTSIWREKCFIVSFTNTLEHRKYFWQEYAPNNGVCIVFNNENISSDICIYKDEELKREMHLIQRSCIDYKKYDSIDDWGYFDITKADVMYVDNIDQYVFKDNTEISAGLIKSKVGLNNENVAKQWELESETRIRVSVRPIGLEHPDLKNKIMPTPTFKYVYIKLPQIDKIIISPNCRPKDRKIIESYLKDKKIKME